MLAKAVRYTLTHPVSTVIIGIDTLPHLEENVRIARQFKPLKQGEMAALEEKTKPYHEEASWYKYRG